jgi:hypothetical protein
MSQNTEIKILRQYGDVPRPVVHEREHPNFEARLAVNLLEKWGMVAAEPDGEDSAGRAKLRLSTPQELAVRACNVASETAAEIRKRGWFVSVPTWAEMEAEIQGRKGK